MWINYLQRLCYNKRITNQESRLAVRGKTAFLFAVFLNFYNIYGTGGFFAPAAKNRLALASIFAQGEPSKLRLRDLP
jgi:hypothetical protein